MTNMVRSVVDISETDWCSLLFDQHGFTEMLCAKLKVSRPSTPFFSIPTNQLVPSARGPGDIDILLAEPGSPESSTVIEVKRIKISEETFVRPEHKNEPTKLIQAATKGVTQANLLGQIGFQRTWLLVVVATDGRARPGFNFFSRGIPWDLQDKICSEPGFARLDSYVGLLFVFFDQPVEKDIAMAGGFGFRLAREATCVDQPASVTASVRDQLFKSGG